jgi:hypothetical protein
MGAFILEAEGEIEAGGKFLFILQYEMHGKGLPIAWQNRKQNKLENW